MAAEGTEGVLQKIEARLGRRYDVEWWKPVGFCLLLPAFVPLVTWTCLVLMRQHGGRLPPPYCAIEMDFAVLRSAAHDYQLAGREGCPTPEELHASGFLGHNPTMSLRSYRIHCERMDFILSWHGLDRCHDTDDDVTNRRGNGERCRGRLITSFWDRFF